MPVRRIIRKEKGFYENKWGYRGASGSRKFSSGDEKIFVSNAWPNIKLCLWNEEGSLMDHISAGYFLMKCSAVDVEKGEQERKTRTKTGMVAVRICLHRIFSREETCVLLSAQS